MSISSSVGGRPVRLKLTLRINVSGLASAAGSSSSSFKRARTKRSILFLTLGSLAIPGTFGFLGLTKAQ